jgi:hypothetical protein
MIEFPINVVTVSNSGEEVHCVTCMSIERVFAEGLPPKAIIGILRRPLGSSEKIEPSNFTRNRVVVDFMHDVISRRCPEIADLKSAARRQGEGWVYLLDARTKTPKGAVPPEDIIGAFAVKAGEIVSGSYAPNPRHLLFSSNGIFQLPPEFRKMLLDELHAPK